MPDERPKRIELTVSDELWDRINEARGFEPRASFVKRALESALGPESTGSSAGTAPDGPAVPVPTRASEEPVATVLGAKVFKGASVPAFKCPIARCEFTAKSPAAKCGAHGRTVVPV